MCVCFLSHMISHQIVIMELLHTIQAIKTDITAGQEREIFWCLRSLNIEKLAILGPFKTYTSPAISIII